MVDEKDHLRDKLQKKEKAEEDQFIKERERAALERLRQQRAAAEHGVVRDRCPRCGEQLAHVTLHGVKVEECPTGHGMWLDKSEIEVIARRERDSWLGSIFYTPRR